MPYLPEQTYKKILVLVFLAIFTFTLSSAIITNTQRLIDGSSASSAKTALTVIIQIGLLVLLLLKRPLGWMACYALEVAVFVYYIFTVFKHYGIENFTMINATFRTVIPVVIAYTVLLLLGPIRTHFKIGRKRLKYSTMFGILVGSLIIFYTNNAALF